MVEENVEFPNKNIISFLFKKYQAVIIAVIGIAFGIFFLITLFFTHNNASDNTSSIENTVVDLPDGAQEKISEQNLESKKSKTAKSVQAPVPAKPQCSQGCFDSDKGINTNDFGEINYGTNTTCITKYDRCVNYKQLEEFYCEEGILASNIVTCSQGCNLGACVPEQYNK